MIATITRFRSKRDRLRADQGEELRQLVLQWAEDEGVEDETVSPLIAAVDGQTATREGWSFVMLSPVQNAAVVRWLRDNSRRPVAALGVWAECFTGLRMDTGEIVIKRADLAERVGILPCDVSRIISELVSIGAISRERSGRGVRYFMNPNVGTCLSGRARERAQSKAVQLTLLDSP